MKARRERILQAASRLVLLQGYNRTTIDDIARESGVKKGNLFYHFRSKEEIGFAILEQQVEALRERILADSFSPDRPPLERVFTFLDRLLDHSRQHEHRGGCPFANLAGEMSDSHEGFRQALLDTFEALRVDIEQALTEARCQYGVEVSPCELSRFVLATVEGAMLLTKVHRSGDTLQASTESLKDYLRRCYGLEAPVRTAPPEPSLA